MLTGTGAQCKHFWTVMLMVSRINGLEIHTDGRHMDITLSFVVYFWFLLTTIFLKSLNPQCNNYLGNEFRGLLPK